jgi:GNAT superfamily N-acetyltransferase
MQKNDHFKIEKMEGDDFFPLFKKYHKLVFAKDHSYSPADVMIEREKDLLKNLSKNLDNTFTLNLVAFEKNEFVGWSFGFQDSREKYYMCNSGVLKEHRRKGLYSQLLQETLKIASEEGFQIISSRHCATNNPVIIPKLKAGFVISGMELSDQFGTLVNLHYYINSKRREILDYRCGESSPNQQIRDLFD